MKIYYNTRCSKCRIAKEFLETEDSTGETTIEYGSGVSLSALGEEFKNNYNYNNLNVLDIVRKNEEEYKLYIRAKNLSEGEIINLICKYPRLLQRPILFNDVKAIVARDEESLNKLKKW